MTPCGGGGKSNGGIPEVGGGTDISGNAGLRLYSRRSAVITCNQSAKTDLDKTSYQWLLQHSYLLEWKQQFVRLSRSHFMSPE
jgi:hypothetical protein